MLTSFRNKSVIVTGGTKGIGKGIAKVFAALGAQACVIGRDENDGTAAVEALSRGGGTAIELPKFKITINAVLPVNVITDGRAGMGQEYIATMAAAIPLKRLGSVERSVTRWGSRLLRRRVLPRARLSWTAGKPCRSRCKPWRIDIDFCTLKTEDESSQRRAIPRKL